MTDAWYYAENELVIGPVSLGTLRGRLLGISNWKDLPVWRRGLEEWQRAGSCKEISAGLETPPVPKSGIVQSRPELAPASEKSTGRWVARILGGIALVAAGAVVGAFWIIMDKGAYELGRRAQEFLAKPSLVEGASDVEQRNAKILGQLRAELPKKIDEMTTLTWVKSEGTKLIYENRVAVEAAKLDDAMKGKLRHSVITNVCGATGTRKILALGGSFQYVYADLAGKPLMTIDVAKSNCP